MACQDGGLWLASRLCINAYQWRQNGRYPWYRSWPAKPTYLCGDCYCLHGPFKARSSHVEVASRRSRWQDVWTPPLGYRPSQASCPSCFITVLSTSTYHSAATTYHNGSHPSSSALWCTSTSFGRKCRCCNLSSYCERISSCCFRY